VCFFTRSESPAFSLIIYSLIINESTPKAFFTQTDRQRISILKPFFFAFFVVQKKRRFAFIFLTNQRARAFFVVVVVV